MKGKWGGGGGGGGLHHLINQQSFSVFWLILYVDYCQYSRWVARPHSAVGMASDS